MKAIWNDTVLAESSDTIVVEGNHYFPRESIVTDYFTDSAQRSTCHWKGEAHYYTIAVGGEQNEDAAWFYPDPHAAANNIKDYVAFWKGVIVTE